MINRAAQNSAETQAWELLNLITLRVVSAHLPGLRSVMAIGSLPGGYFRPDQSDLDMVVLFNEIPADSQSELMLREKLLELSSQNLPITGFDLECLPRYVPDLGRNPVDNLLYYPDLVARLKLQGHQLYGNYPLDTLEMPSRADWKKELGQFLIHWGQKPPETAQSIQGTVKYTLTLMRFYLAIERHAVQYNKFKLVDAYDANKPVIKLPVPIKAFIRASLMGWEISPSALERAQTELPGFQFELLKALT